MNPSLETIWHTLPADLPSQISRCVDAAAERLHGAPAYIFFRADDVAVPGKQFRRLKEIFSQNRTPLCLAVVPAWLTAARWSHLEEPGRHTPELWCWHQHGWRHINHAKTGKKQEFGPTRRRTAIRQDLIRGRQRLEDLLGKKFYPVFTPPWNRCDLNTLEHLHADGYTAVSRSAGAGPLPRHGLPDIFINVDLHTRTETDPASAWNNLLAELRNSLSAGYCGIMIHHQRMNPAAFEFLNILLAILVKHKDFSLVHFRDLVDIP
jgi:hypothetical protein